MLNPALARRIHCKLRGMSIGRGNGGFWERGGRHTCLSMYDCASMYFYVCIYIYIYALIVQQFSLCEMLPIHICIYIRMCICIYIYIYMHICTYAHYLCRVFLPHFFLSFLPFSPSPSFIPSLLPSFFPNKIEGTNTKDDRKMLR